MNGLIVSGGGEWPYSVSHSPPPYSHHPATCSIFIDTFSCRVCVFYSSVVCGGVQSGVVVDECLITCMY